MATDGWFMGLLRFLLKPTTGLIQVLQVLRMPFLDKFLLKELTEKYDQPYQNSHVIDVRISGTVRDPTLKKQWKSVTALPSISKESQRKRIFQFHQQEDSEYLMDDFSMDDLHKVP